MKITTNNKPRPMVCLACLPADVQKDFDYITGDDVYTPRLVQYKGAWYDVYDTMTVRRPLGGAYVREFTGWDSYISETFFSGVVFRIVGPASDDVIVGRYFS